MKTETLITRNKSRLKTALKDITDKTLRGCCLDILNYEEFFYWVGSLGKHHGYEGGLFEHTLEVLDLATQSEKSWSFAIRPNKDILIASALWHDVAKIWDYEYTERPPFGYVPPDNHYVPKVEISAGTKDSRFVAGYWTRSTYHKKVHHISGSLGEFTAAALKAGVSRETINKVQHCIISHHGFNPDFGSPKIPVSLEAIILHQADMLSATYGATAQKRP